MYKIATQTKALLSATSLALALGFSSAAVAGPGKPGINGIADGGNIVEVAIAANGVLDVFNTVLAAAQCDFFGGAVVDILTGEDKVTLFAPTDQAFDDLNLGLNADTICDAFRGTDDTMLDGPELALLEILAYHVTDGRRFSNSVFNANNAKSIEMLTGDYVISFVDATDGPLLHDAVGRMSGIVAEAKGVKTFDINAANGVIHTIDAVLLPFLP
jgi:uncharacterized surface protein with fasciclin (FAS1) repeats